MPAVLLILRLLTGIGSLFRLAASALRWSKRRGKSGPAPVLRPRFSWELDGEPPARLEVRFKNDGSRSAIIDSVTVQVTRRGATSEVPLPAEWEDRYPIQVKPDESTGWFDIPLADDVVEWVRERSRLAATRTEAEPLTSGLVVSIGHEHGTERVEVPGPWVAAAAATASSRAPVLDDSPDSDLEHATVVLDDPDADADADALLGHS